MYIKRQMQQRGRDPHILFERILYKGAKGIEELEDYLKKLIVLVNQFEDEEGTHLTDQNTDVDEEITQLVAEFLNKTKANYNNETHRCLLVQSLESIAFELEQYKHMRRHISKLALTILKYFRDSSDKVRLTAIGSMYNLLNKYSQSGLNIFMQTFEAVSALISDDSGQIRQAATFLNQTLKTLINDAVFDQIPFDLRGFIEMLSQNFQSDSVIFKQFLLDWLMAIEQIPHFQLSFDLPHFFKQVFQMLLSSSKNLKTKAEECLKKFLHVFRQILALNGKLSTKLNPDNALVLIEMALIMIRENLSTETTLHALEWLQVFTKFFSLQIHKREESFLEPIYVNHFRDIILVIITTLTDDTERIRKISHKINDALLAAFPVMSKDEKKLNEGSLLLQKLLQENKSPVRVEAILKWTILLLHHNSEKMLSEINVLIEHIVQKLCDRNATKSLFALLEGSLFMEEYFDLFIQTLFSFLFQNQTVLPEPILKQLLALEHSELNFMIICNRVNAFQNDQFQYRLIESLISILITESSLEPLRNKLQQQDYDLFDQLFQCFSKNEAALLMLSFLSKQYRLIVQFMKLLAHTERITGHKFKSLIKMSNLIQNSNMNHLRADLRESALAIKAYLSLLMALPHGKYYNLLLQRLPPHPSALREQTLNEKEQTFTASLLKRCELSYNNEIKGQHRDRPQLQQRSYR